MDWSKTFTFSLFRLTTTTSTGIRPDGAHREHHRGPPEPDRPAAAAQLPDGPPRSGVERGGVQQQRSGGVRAVHAPRQGRRWKVLLIMYILSCVLCTASVLLLLLLPLLLLLLLLLLVLLLLLLLLLLSPLLTPVCCDFFFRGQGLVLLC